MDNIYQVDELMSRILTREQLYRTQVGTYRSTAKSKFDETVSDLTRRILETQRNDPVSVPAEVLVYNPHNPMSREFYFREGLESPGRRQQRQRYLDNLTTGSVPEAIRMSYRIVKEKSVGGYDVFMPAVKLPVSGMQQKKYVFADKPGFLAQLTSPVSRLNGFRYEQSLRQPKK